MRREGDPLNEVWLSVSNAIGLLPSAVCLCFAWDGCREWPATCSRSRSSRVRTPLCPRDDPYGPPDERWLDSIDHSAY